MIDAYKTAAGNADSRTHDYGTRARRLVEEARGQVASILRVQNNEVFFTSGATESNNIAILGLKDYARATGKKHIITSAIEHKAVLGAINSLKREGFDVSIVNPDNSGRVSAKTIQGLVRKDTLLVSIMHVNNETGVIQPVNELGDFLFDKEVLFHVDATQSFGKLVDEIRNLKYDMLSMSAHKIGGPQGIGALILRRKNYKLPPVKGIMYGGQQEHGIRPGTTPVALVAGMGLACELAKKEYKENNSKCETIKACLMRLLKESGISYDLNGDQTHVVSNTLSICFHGVSSEALMLSSKEFCSISNGSACNSNSYEPSFVLQAMGIPDENIENSVRVSWGPSCDIKEIEDSFTSLLNVVKLLAL